MTPNLKIPVIPKIPKLKNPKTGMITVGLPVYNEEKGIVFAIESLMYQLNHDDEVIVVASGCTDGTVDKVKKLIDNDDRILLVIESKRKGKASAINLINKYAQGDIIIQFDGDSSLDNDSIKKILEPFKDPQVGAVSGNPQAYILRNNLFYDWTMMSYRKMHEIRLKEDAKNKFWHLSGYLLAWRNGCLPEVPFVKGAVDAWMGKLINDDGWIIRYAPDANVYVTAPHNIKDFVAQKARVRAGYYNLPKMPRTVSKEILWLPKEFLKVPIWRWHKFFISGCVYTYSWIKGRYLAKTNKSLEQIWKVPESTK